MAKIRKDEGSIRFNSSALEKYRAYLKVMAQVRITRDLRRHVDPSDVVQQTLMDAYRCRAQFRGKTEKERAAWFRQILTRNLLNLYRTLTCQKRDFAKERSLEEMLTQSSRRMAAWLPASKADISEGLEREEQALVLVQGLSQLTEEQREVVALRILEGLSPSQIGQILNLPPAAVGGRLRRGIERLSEIVQGQAKGDETEDDPFPGGQGLASD